jgi:hypothetical protein
MMATQDKPIWSGTVTVVLKATFVYEVDESWQVTSEEEAKRQIEGELVNYMGNAFVDNRFAETWKFEPDESGLVPIPPCDGGQVP